MTTLLDVTNADAMIENVIGVMGLPVGLGLNFLINGKDYVVPLVVEEPSIVAALSFAAKTARSAGGFITSSTRTDSDRPDPAGRRPTPDQGADSCWSSARRRSSTWPTACTREWWRAAAVRSISRSCSIPPTGDNVEMLVVHLLVNTCDAMGANLVNTMCEGVASFVESLTGGKVFLRILSNLTDRVAGAGAVDDPGGRSSAATAMTASRFATASSSPASSPASTRTGPRPTTRAS